MVGSYAQPWAIQLQVPNNTGDAEPKPQPTATVVGHQEILAPEPPVALAPKREATPVPAPAKPAWMASFAFAKYKGPSGTNDASPVPPPVTKAPKLEPGPPATLKRTYRDVAMEPARPVDVLDYSEDDAEFLPVGLASPP